MSPPEIKSAVELRGSPMKVLLTGGTGFLGKWITQQLDQARIPWVGISRSGEQGLRGDLKLWDLGLPLEDLKKEKFTVFLNMGAIYDFRARPRDIHCTNVNGTLSALIVAKKLKISHFFHLSSIAAVINTPNKVVGENDLYTELPFPDPYGESKALSEKILKQWQGEFQSAVNLRLGILVGDSLGGSPLRMDGPYRMFEIFRALKKNIYYFPFPLILPGHKGAKIPLVPVDRAAFALVELLKQSPETHGFHSLHLVPSEPVEILKLYRDCLGFFWVGPQESETLGKATLQNGAKNSQWPVSLSKRRGLLSPEYALFPKLSYKEIFIR